MISVTEKCWCNNESYNTILSKMTGLEVPVIAMKWPGSSWMFVSNVMSGNVEEIWTIATPEFWTYGIAPAPRFLFQVTVAPIWGRWRAVFTPPSSQLLSLASGGGATNTEHMSITWASQMVDTLVIGDIQFHPITQQSIHRLWLLGTLYPCIQN